MGHKVTIGIDKREKIFINPATGQEITPQQAYGRNKIKANNVEEHKAEDREREENQEGEGKAKE